MVTSKSDDKGKVRVLVYGTLKKNHLNHSLLEKARADFLGYDSITGLYKFYDLGGIPALQQINEGKSITVYGQVFATNDEGLAALDHLEGHPSFYQRRKLVTDRLGKRVWVYFLDHPGYINDKTNDISDSGIWKPFSPEAEYWKKQKSAAQRHASKTS